MALPLQEATLAGEVSILFSVMIMPFIRQSALVV